MGKEQAFILNMTLESTSLLDSYQVFLATEHFEDNLCLVCLGMLMKNEEMT